MTQIELGEGLEQSTHIVYGRYPVESPSLEAIHYVSEDGALADVLTDEANFPGGEIAGLIEFTEDAGTAEVSHVLRQAHEQGQRVIAVGPQTSLTGAAVPTGEVVLNMFNNRKAQSEVFETETGYAITVQSGVTLEELELTLKSKGLFFPAGPTEEHATVVGAISTNGAGARSYKYGKTQRYVESLKFVLVTGEEFDIRRGQYTAMPGDEESPGGYFLLDLESGQRRVPLPRYVMPNVPKASVGYNAQPTMDLIDLLTGSEGTLGVITEATIRVLEEPATTMALIPCNSDQQAFDLIALLENQEPEKRTTLEPGGISAVEIIGSRATELIRTTGPIMDKTGADIHLPDGAAFLIVQIEEGVDDSLMQFAEHCDAVGIDLEAIKMAEPNDQKVKDQFITIRETVPRRVNEAIRRYKEHDAAVTKVGADPCVQPARIAGMMRVFQEEFDAAEVEFYWWGHGEGNIHYNALPRSVGEVERAKVAALRAGVRVIKELDGVGTAEHGVGKNIMKQLLLLALYGEVGAHEMHDVKRAFDPADMLARGNIVDFNALASEKNANLVAAFQQIIDTYN